LHREDRQRTTISHRLVGAKQLELVIFTNTGAQTVDQSRIVDRETFSVRRFDIDHQLGCVCRDWSQIWAQLLRFIPIDRPGRFLRVSQATAISIYLALSALVEHRKAYFIGI